MSLTWHILTNNVNEVWDQIMQGASNATFFQTRAWADLFSKTFTFWKTDPVIIEFSDGNIMVLPILRHSLTGYRECMIPHVYGGPVFLHPPMDEHLQVVNKVLKWYGDITFVENPFDPYRRGLDFLARWSMETTVTDLTPGYDILWKRFRTKHRQHYNSAVKKGISETVAASLNDIDVYYNIYRNSLHRWGKNARGFYPRSLFRNMLNMPEFGRSIKMWLARKDGIPIGGNIVLYHGIQAVNWHAAYLSSNLSDHPSPFLTITAIKDACEKGYRWFDFMGPNNHLKGVQHFKDGFAAQPLPYNAYYANNTIKGIIFKRYRRFKEKSLRLCPM